VLALAGMRLAVHLGPAATWLPPVRSLFPALAGWGRPDRVALTFDDGPSADRTPRVLEVLAGAGIEATFFLVAERLRENLGVGRAIVAAGHEVAVHAWRHDYLIGHSYRRTLTDLARARDLVGEVAGEAPRWFRPPYGVLTGEAAFAARRLGLRPVLWTAWARDWTASASPENIRALLEPGLVGGATVLLHDAGRSGPPGDDATVRALPGIIAEIRARGLCPGPLRAHGL
jgi:peptidoglycan/xylan/chitin deacetylase (PgdA/CDA1 family)